MDRVNFNNSKTKTASPVLWPGTQLIFGTVHSLTQSVGCYFRSKELWEKATNIGAYLIGLEYGLTGHKKRPAGRHMVNVSFAEWMMGVPRGWTCQTP